jgi:hypothetical protein
MKKFLLLPLLLFTTAVLAQYTSADKVLSTVYSAHRSVCIATAVDATNANVPAASGTPIPFTGWNEIYGYTSATDFTGVGIECLQGADATVTVHEKVGTKIPAGSHVVWYFGSNSDYISCQTASGSGYFDVCPLEDF